MLKKLQVAVNFILCKQLLLFTVIFSSYHSSLYAEQFIVQDIIFEGLQRVDLNWILSIVPVRIGDIMDSNNDADKIIKSLFFTGKFENIQVSRYKDIIIIQVKERPIIANIDICGNKMIREQELRNILGSENIQVGNILNFFSIVEVEKKISELYHSIGKFKVTIKTEITPISRHRVDLKIFFNEYESAKIKKINIIGNNVFNTSKLLSYFQFYNQTLWWNFIKKFEYHDQKLFFDLQLLRDFYLSKGYIQFNIDSIHISFNPNQNDVYMTLYVTEGDKYFFSKTVIDDALLISFPKIKEFIKINQGEIYNYLKIKKMKNDIEYLLGNNGYLYPSITIEEKINDYDKTVELHVLVSLGNRFYVRQIYFEGNNITEDKVLRREINQMEGTWFTRHFVDKGKANLEKLGYFDSVDVEIKHVSNAPDQIDLLYKVKERNTGNMNINFGISTRGNINFQFGIQENNWLGTGNMFGFSGIKNNYQTYTELSVFSSYLTLYSMNFNGKLFYNCLNANNSELSDYNLKSYGITTNIGLPFTFTKNHSLNLGVDYVYNDLSNIEAQIAICRYLKAKSNSNDSVNSILNGQIYNNLNFIAKDFFLIFGWNYNSLNRGYFPTKGSYANFLSKITIPGSDNEYFKIVLDIDHYLPINISNNWIFMNRMQFGCAFGIHTKESPFYDNFYAGGTNSVRGFRSNTIGPKAVYYKCNSNDISYDSCTLENSNDAMGGNIIVVIRNEFIMPILSLLIDQNCENSIRTSFFIDLGNVWDSYWNNTINTRSAGILNYKNPKNIRISNGVAVQWMSPFGPMIFSYAKIIKSYKGDQLEQFQFNIGKTW